MCTKGQARTTKGASLFVQLGSRAGGHKVPQRREGEGAESRDRGRGRERGKGRAAGSGCGRGRGRARGGPRPTQI